MSLVSDADGTSPPGELSEVLTITNSGEVELHISGVSVDTPDSPFSVSAASTVLLPPGGSSQVTVSFSPEGPAEYSAAVLIGSDDPDEPTVEVPLSGTGRAPLIDLSPPDFDFGTLYLGCDTVQTLSISNLGNAELVVSELAFTTDSEFLGFDLAETVNGALPWTLAAGESLEVFVDYEPWDVYEDSGFLQVISEDPWRPSIISLFEGTGALYGENLDVFELPIKGDTDIIFAFDMGRSMYESITEVQYNFATFTSTLAGLDADYRVAATVEDSGCINGEALFIDNTFSASDARSTLGTMLGLGGAYGSNTERGFMLLEASLSEVGVGGCNEGLVRDDAKLNLVLVSNHAEQSEHDYSYYVALFQSMKVDPEDVVVHAIGGDLPSGCGSASAYTGAYEATVATGGQFLSICSSDWGALFEELAAGAVPDLGSFKLSDWPVPGTLVVRLDGSPTSEGWTYDESANTVVFDSDNVPVGGTLIEVEYGLYGECDE